MKNIIRKIAMMPQNLLAGVFGTKTGITGLVASLKHNITHNTWATLVFFIASIPLWLVWGVFIMRGLVQIAIPDYAINIAIESPLLTITAVVLLCRGSIIYAVNNPDRHLNHNSRIKNYAKTITQTAWYTLKYMKEKFITAGLYLILILILPLLLTGSTIVFIIAIATVFIIWKLKRESSIDVFYKGFIIEALLVIMWLEFITAPGTTHQTILFLMILATTGIFSAIRLNKIAQQQQRQHCT